MIKKVYYFSNNQKHVLLLQDPTLTLLDNGVYKLEDAFTIAYALHSNGNFVLHNDRNYAAMTHDLGNFATIAFAHNGSIIKIDDANIDPILKVYYTLKLDTCAEPWYYVENRLELEQ